MFIPDSDTALDSDTGSFTHDSDTGTLTRDSDTRSLIQDIRSSAPIVVWSIVLRSRFLLVKQGQKIEVDGVLAISFMELNDPPVAEYVPA